MLFRATRHSCASLLVAFAGCGELYSYVAVNVRGWGGIDSIHSCADGFQDPMFCILILWLASPLRIPGKSRMRKRARTDLCGGRSVMVVPTATVIDAVNFAQRLAAPGLFGKPYLTGLGKSSPSLGHNPERRR